MSCRTDKDSSGSASYGLKNAEREGSGHHKLPFSNRIHEVGMFELGSLFRSHPAIQAILYGAAYVEI